MIRVLQILSNIGNHGVEAVVMNYYRYIDRACVQFDFAVTGTVEERFKREIAEYGGRIFYLPSKSRYPFRYYREMKRLLTAHPEYGIIHANANSASLVLDLKAAAHCGVPVRIAHSHNASCAIRWQHRLLKRYVNKYATERFACSYDAAVWMFGKKASRATVVRNAIQPENFRYDPEARKDIRQVLGVKDDTILLGNVGGLTKNKNQVFLLRVLALLRQKNHESYKLILVGEGAERESLLRTADTFGVRDDVIFYGSTAEVGRVYSAFDIFVFPSAYEGLGIVVIEAAQNGLPCLISDAVPREAVVAATVKPIALIEQLWADEIIKCPTGRKDTSAEIINAGYVIRDEAKKLQKIYENLSNGLKKDRDAEGQFDVGTGAQNE